MARAVWSGSISFGLVNVGVKAYTAVRDHEVRFHQIDKKSGARVRYEKVSEKTHKKLAREGGTVLGIDVKENTGAALTAKHEFGLSYPNLRDPDGSYVRHFGQTGYPETYVLDRRGRIAAVRRFPVTQQWLDRTLPPLLRERA